MKRNELKDAFTKMPDDCYRALMSAAHRAEEEAPVKRKSGLVLVMAIVLVLLAGVALALATFRDTARNIVAVQQESGYYKDWPVENRVALARALVEQGYAEKTPEVEKMLNGTLREEEARRLADAVLVAFTGVEVREISFMEIMIAAWGPFEGWTKEEQAWYSQLMVDMNIQKDDHTLYVLPEGPVDEEEAIAIARREIARGFGIEESILDGYALTTSFQVPEFAEPGDKQAYWYVEFMGTDKTPENARPFNAFWVFIHPDTGKLLQPIEEQVAEYQAYWDRVEARENDPLYQEMRAFSDTYGSSPFRWNLEAKAEWSQRFAERIRERMKDDPEPFGYIEGAMASFVYGLPDEKTIPEEKAFEIAKAVLVEQMGRKEEEVYFFARYCDVYYDITDPAKPLWKFFFRMPNEYVSDEAFGKEVLAYYGKNGERLPNIKVELDAYTGDVVRAFFLDFADVNSAEDHALSM